ncbi:MAG: histidine phosphatase family protein [Ruminococcaceae bacterium]|nr:histidine phosphatase family protein [Oscillospiraceae bacterium]
MSKCRVILVRHGQSEGNLHNQFLGHTDLELTELGHKQAQLTAEHLDSIDIDIIYASDLKRAWQTAEHIADRKQLSIIADSQLREIYAGKWEGLEFDKLWQDYGEDFKVWKEDIGASRCTEGESFAELYERIIKELIRIAELNDGMTVCIATHATPIRCARLKAFGYGFDKAKDIGWTSNASITTIDIEDGEFTMIEDNYHEHMGILDTKLPPNV